MSVPKAETSGLQFESTLSLKSIQALIDAKDKKKFEKLEELEFKNQIINGKWPRTVAELSKTADQKVFLLPLAFKMQKVDFSPTILSQRIINTKVSLDSYPYRVEPVRCFFLTEDDLTKNIFDADYSIAQFGITDKPYIFVSNAPALAKMFMRKVEAHKYTKYEFSFLLAKLASLSINGVV